MTLMAQFETSEQIAEYMRQRGLYESSTGGGFSAWFLETQCRMGTWQIMITDGQTDTSKLSPGHEVAIGLYPPGGNGGPAGTFEILDSVEKLPDALDKFQRIGEQQFGIGEIVKR